MSVENDNDDSGGRGGITRIVLKFVVVSALGVASYAFFEPLKTITKNYLWPENIELHETASGIVGVAQGYQFSLVNKSSVAGISGGAILFVPQGQGIEVVGKSKFIIGPSEGSVSVPSSEKLMIITRREGEHRLLAKIETQRGAKFEGEVIIHSKPRSLVTTDDYSGVWDVLLNEVSGTMKIEQTSPSDRHFGGRITLSDGTHLNISPSASKWDGRTIVIWATNEFGDEYSFQSRKCRLEIDDKYWVFAHGDYKVHLKNGGSKDLEYNYSTYVEKCPGSESVSPRENSGSFFARVASR